MKAKTSPIKIQITQVILSAALAFLPIASPLIASAQTRTEERGLVYSEAKGSNKVSRYYALVIGNNDYQYVGKLKTAVHDAEVMEKVLREGYGFETRLLLNADRNQILMSLNEYRRTLGEDSNFLIYYAGHGEYDTDVEKAYWLPVDARPDDNVAWVSADDVTTNVKGILARHVLIISDSCYSGMIPRYGKTSLKPLERERYLQKMMDGRSRILMSSGGNEPVADQGGAGHSVFARALLKGLTDIEENVFTGEELFYRFIRESVAGQSDQTPQYNPIRNSGHDSGDFIFIRKTNVKQAQPQSMTPTDIELAFWETIKSSSNPDDYKAYLAKYPDGSFASLAIIRAEPEPPSTPLAELLTTAEATPSGGYEFNVVKANSNAEIIERRPSHSRYFIEDLGGVALEMVEIPGGSFLMGARHAELRRFPDAETQHLVTVPSFHMGRFEVTQAQWRAVAGLPKVSRDLAPDPSKFKGDNLPVEQVSWEDAEEFCARLSKKTGIEYRLPTEAEWEFACRAGTTTAFHFGDTITPELANYAGAKRGHTMAVGSLGHANGFGLYDMHGNVEEWCLDPWHENYKDAPTDGSVWENRGDKKYRVLRGGAWNYIAGLCRAANRSKSRPDHRDSVKGFRVVFSGERPLPDSNRLVETRMARGEIIPNPVPAQANKEQMQKNSLPPISQDKPQKTPSGTVNQDNIQKPSQPSLPTSYKTKAVRRPGKQGGRKPGFE